MNLNPPTITKVFQSGNSQAVRIPASFRLDTDRVAISYTSSGGILLEPLPVLQKNQEKGKAFLALFDGFPNDFIEAVSERDTSLPQERADM